jgi:hypothetical protein
MNVTITRKEPNAYVGAGPEEFNNDDPPNKPLDSR